MKLSNKFKAATQLAKVKLLGRRIPVAIRWQLTNRCPSRCLYCNLWEQPSPELSTEQIFDIIDQLKKAGTVRISYSGGEPMLREDLGKIIDYTVKKGISASINSNGYQIPERTDELKNLDLAKISLDGPRELDNKVRGIPEAYGWAVDAAEALYKERRNFTFCTTITKYNIDTLDFMVELARKYETMVAFQPLKTIYRGVKDMNDIYPSPEDWERAMRTLRGLKRKYPENIRNSELLLDHIESWPKYGKFTCYSGKAFAIIDVDGSLVPCDRVDYPRENTPSILEFGFEKAWSILPEAKCSGCGFCGACELNFLLEGNFKIIKELSNLLKA